MPITRLFPHARIAVLGLSTALIALSGCQSAPKYASNEALGVATITAFAETPPVNTTEDSADDPAVWVNTSYPAQSLILGTNKQEGLHVYGLSGAQVQFLPVGKLNNVDVRTISTPEGQRHIAAATNRTHNSVTLFEIDATSSAVSVLGDLSIEEPEVYGYCLGVAQDGSLLSIVNTKTAKVLIHRIILDGKSIMGELLDTWQFDGQMEGCASDDDAGVIFIGEEEYGVWRVTHDNGVETSRTAIDTIATDQGLVMDVEGLDIWKGKDGAGYLVVSAQAADRFVVYDRMAPHAKVGIFTIGDNTAANVDGVSHTDGLTVVSANLGEELPHGLFVAQDDANTDPDAAQNFKLVDWRMVETALGLTQ